MNFSLKRNEWTFEGAGEVTVNLFSMHAMEFVVGIPLKGSFVVHHKSSTTNCFMCLCLDQEWPLHVIPRFKAYFEKQPTYADWQGECGVALMTFAQLILHFGWPAMRQFMSDYEKDIKSGENLPKNNQEEIDQWVIRYSRIVNRNIRPQFEMFGLPVTDQVNAAVAKLAPWCPVNEKDGNVFFQKY